MQGTATGAFHLPEHNASLLFVTLNKSDKDFSPTTQYNDCVINENLKFRIWNSSRLSILSKCSQSLVILNNLDG